VQLISGITMVDEIFYHVLQCRSNNRHPVNCHKQLQYVTIAGINKIACVCTKLLIQTLLHHCFYKFMFLHNPALFLWNLQMNILFLSANVSFLLVFYIYGINWLWFAPFNFLIILHFSNAFWGEGGGHCSNLADLLMNGPLFVQCKECGPWNFPF
jgi:hypothetical protein